jgi:hypothetical protein
MPPSFSFSATILMPVMRKNMHTYTTVYNVVL